MRIISRAEWGARAPASPFTKVAISARTATCVHHDGPAPITVRTFDEAVALVRRDEAYHMDKQGWAGIGYNMLVISAPGFPEVDGLIFEARGRDVVGAHCKDRNTPWLGVQVAIGGGQQPSPAALASTRWLHDSFVTAACHPLAMKGHRDGFATACPDPILYAWIQAGMPVDATRTAPPGPSRGTTRKPVPTKPAPPKLTGGLTMTTLDFGQVTAASTTWIRGPGVKPLQKLLSITADGLGGPGTRAALVAWQQRAGVKPDGAFGPISASAMLAGR